MGQKVSITARGIQTGLLKSIGRGVLMNVMRIIAWEARFQKIGKGGVPPTRVFLQKRLQACERAALVIFDGAKEAASD